MKNEARAKTRTYRNTTPASLQHTHVLPEIGYLRLPRILGDPKADPPIPAIIPVGKSTWWAGVKDGRFPKPVKLGPRMTAWDVRDIRELIRQLQHQDAAGE